MIKTMKAGVSLKEMLRQEKTQIMDVWTRRMQHASTDGIATFLNRPQNRFANPVAYAFKEAMEAIYQALLNDCEVDGNILEYAIKIKAVHEKDASAAVEFIFLLKDAIRTKTDRLAAPGEFADMELRIDQIAALALDMFNKNRSKIAGISAKTNNPLVPNHEIPAG
jgi:hypothetical protein